MLTLHGKISELTWYFIGVSIIKWFNLFKLRKSIDRKLNLQIMLGFTHPELSCGVFFVGATDVDSSSDGKTSTLLLVDCITCSAFSCYKNKNKFVTKSVNCKYNYY